MLSTCYISAGTLTKLDQFFKANVRMLLHVQMSKVPDMDKSFADIITFINMTVLRLNRKKAE